MARSDSKPPYSVFAKFYDQIAEPLRAPNLRARQRVLSPILKRLGLRAPSPESPISVCDLCCGTGTTALEFARRGMRVYAVDGSRNMLKVARANFAKSHARVRTIHADMRKFRLPEPVDLITCEFDAINHVQHKRDLIAVAKSVARALKPGGRFFFDANTRRAFEKLWVMNWVQEGDGFFMAGRGGYNPNRDKGWLEWTWFLPERSDRWRRFTEHYEEVAWTKQEIRAALNSAGLRVQGYWDLVRFAGGAPWAMPGCRYFWLAEKQKDH
jgi:SAM-dependent methyltransferase